MCKMEHQNTEAWKLQSSLAKSLFQLKSRDQIISTLKTQLRATQAASELPTSTPPQSMKLNAEAIEAQNAVEEAKARAIAAETRTAELQLEVHQLVEASKQGGEAQAAQMQSLQKELSEAKKIAAECADAKEMQDQMVKTLKVAVSEAMSEKEATFERLGEARELTAELQDALRSANSQIRMLRCEVAALHEQIDCCAASGPPTPPSDPSVDPTGSQAETLNGEAVTDTASAKGDVEELQVLLRTTREEVDSVKAALAASHTPRASAAAAAPNSSNAATSPTANATPHALDTEEASQKLQEASDHEASMEKRISELEGELENVRKEQLQREASVHKGDSVATQSDKGVATGAVEEEMTKLNGELERLQAAEVQASEELAWRVQELAAERQRSAHAERALQEAQEAAKAEAEHLAAQLAEVREQLVVGASDEALSAHLSEFVAARTSLFEVVDAQEAELESLRGQLESVLESKDAETAFAQMQGTFAAMRTALGRRSPSMANSDSTATATGTLHTTQNTQSSTARSNAGATAAAVLSSNDTGGGGEQRATEGWGDGWDSWDGATVDNTTSAGLPEPSMDAPPVPGGPAKMGPFGPDVRAQEQLEQLTQQLEEATEQTRTALAETVEAREIARVAEVARDEALEKVIVAEVAQRDTMGGAQQSAVVDSDVTAEGVSGSEGLEVQLMELQKVLEACQAERDTTRSAMAMAEMLSQKHEAEADTLRKDLEAAQAEHAQHATAWSAQVAETESQLVELQKVLAACQAERDTTLSALAMAEMLSQKHESEACELQQALEAAQTERDTARSAQVGETGGQLVELQKALEASQKDRDAAQSELAAAEALAQRNEAVADSLRKDLEAAVAKHDAAQSAAESAAEDTESEVRKRSAAALKKTKALHEAQMAELRGEVEAALQARHEDTLSAEQRVESERQRAVEAEAVAAARLQAVTDAEAQAQQQCDAADAKVAEAQTACVAAEKARDEALAAKEKAEGEMEAARQGLTTSEASKETSSKEASARESRLKKALSELRHKMDAAMAEQSRAQASAAEARTRIEAVQSERATAEARAQMLEREVEKLQKEGAEYRGRAQALLAQKDKEIEGVRSKGAGGEEKGVAEMIGMVSEMRSELAKKEVDFAAALATVQEEKRAAEERAERAAQEANELRSSLDAALARSAAADSLRQRATEAESRLAARDAAAAAAAAGGAAPAAPSAGDMRAQLEAARAEVVSSQAEHAAFKDMAYAREDALSAALEQVAELKAELEDLKAAGAIPTPSTPALGDQVSANGMVHAHSRGGMLESGHGSSFRLNHGRSDSFELGEVLSHKSMPGAEAGLRAPGLGSGNWTQSGDFGGFLGDKTKELRDRVAELEEENGELLADARRHEEQLAVLKEELRAVDRAEKRAETSSNAQVMEFLKANIISLYATGEAERLLEPFGQMLALSANEKKQCKDGLARWKGLEHESSGGYLGALFGVR